MTTTQIKHNRLPRFKNSVAQTLTGRAADIAISLLGEPNRALSSRRELRFGRKGSVAVVINGAKAGRWYDHEINVGGDLVSLIRRHQGGSLLDAVAYAERFVGGPIRPGTPTTTAHRHQGDDYCIRNRRLAYELWHEAVTIAGTVAARYLATRGILPLVDNSDGTVLRFHPSCPYGLTRHPCLVALMRDLRTNEPCAIQRTALTQTGGKIGRMTLGPKMDAAVKLSSDEHVTTGLAVGEGLETVLSAMRLGFSPAWALGDAGNVRRFPVLSGVECLTLIVDNDESGTGQRAALECSRRWTDDGREVFRIIPDRCGDDMNDLIRRKLS
jgi:putative DNA primase/helicase